MNISNKQPDFMLQELVKGQTKPKISRRKEITRSEWNNEVETKRAIEETNKTKSWFFLKD